MKNMAPKQKACDQLEKIGEKDLKANLKLIRVWNRQRITKKDCKLSRGETRFHYVNRLKTHFSAKLSKLQEQLAALHQKQGFGKKIEKGCNVIKHLSRRLKVKVCRRMETRNYNCKCAKVLKEKKICKIFDGCYKASVNAYKDNQKASTKKNEAAKLEWRAVGRIECLLTVLGAKKGEKPDAKQLEKCIKGPQVSTKPLDLTFKPIPPKVKCSLKGVSKATRDKCKK